MNAEVNANQIVKALRCCGNTDTKKPDCEHCPLVSTRMCVKVMLEGAADLIVRLNDFDQTQSKIALERCQKAEAQLAASQREKQAAVDGRDELRKAFALACRIMSDNLPACLPDNQSWHDHILDRVRTEPVCRVCGCTEDNACPGGCYWIEPDLCSACAQDGEAVSE